MKNLSVLVSLLCIGQLTLAADLKLNDISLLTMESARMERSDVQGVVVTGGNLTIQDYEIAGNKKWGAIVGGSLNLNRGQIRGSTELQGGASTVQNSLIRGNVQSVQTVSVIQAQIRGTLTSQNRPRIQNGSVSSYRKQNPRFDVKLSDLSAELQNKSASLAQLSPNTSLQQVGSNKLIQATEALSVVRVSSQDLRNQHVMIQASGASQIVIQINEAAVDLSHVTVTLAGIAPEKVSWVMDSATTLMIQNTGEPSLGLPGFVYAPKAFAQFYEGLITGGLYVRTLGFIPEFGLKSGQINGIPSEQNPLN